MTSQLAQPSIWISGRWQDLLLFIATPLLLIPLIVARPYFFSVQELILYLGAFGALGHHLPGMIRAYGDRSLFRRFRWRFIFAPILLGVSCIYFAWNDLGGILLLTFFWTTWHTLMQIYGFARIYDGKAKSFQPWTGRMDHLLCIVWIGAPLLLTDARLASLLELYYRCGGPLLDTQWIGGVQSLWTVALAAITFAFAYHTWRNYRQGHPPNPVKLLFFASSFGFWWFCMAAVDHLLIGIALFDIFHDVQYLALVWMFNRRRVREDPQVGRFSRFLFRRSGALAGLYVGLVIAYGSFGYVSEAISQEQFRNMLLGLVAASALLHFYYDGFIWKVRETQTRVTLGLEGNSAKSNKAIPGLIHLAKWSLFVLPMIGLAFLEIHNDRSPSVWREAIVAAAPNSAEARTNWGAALADQGRYEEAEEQYAAALEVHPRHPETYNNLGLAKRLQGDFEQAQKHLEKAVELNPKYVQAHVNLANVRWRLGEPEAAEQSFLEALRLDSQNAAAHANLGVLLLAKGKADLAIQHWRNCLRVDPDHKGALNNLAWLGATSPKNSHRNGAEAVRLAEHMCSVYAPPTPTMLDTLAAAYAENEAFEQAIKIIRQALEMPEMSDQNLRALFVQRLQTYQAGKPLRQ